MSSLSNIVSGTGNEVKSTNAKTTSNVKTASTAASPGKSTTSNSGVSNILKKGFLNNWSTKKQPPSPQQQQPASSSTTESVSKEKNSASKQGKSNFIYPCLHLFIFDNMTAKRTSVILFWSLTGGNKTTKKPQGNLIINPVYRIQHFFEVSE